jgi:predicted amidohydrolase
MSPSSLSEPTTYRAALVQMAPVHLDKTLNVSRMIQFIEEATNANARLIIFPELIVTGYVGPYDPAEKARFYEAAEPVPGPTTTRLRELAARKNVYVIFGMAERGEDLRGPIMHNVSVMVGPNGFLAYHRKVHLPGEEKLYFSAGNEFDVFNTELGRIALLVCYDFWFPESARIAGLKGAQIIVDIANWPSFDTTTWFSLGPGVAASNVLWLAQVNRVGGEPHWTGFGGSQVIDPSGKVTVTGSDEEGIFYSDLCPADVDRRRMATPVWFDRRPEVYGAIAGQDTDASDTGHG